jgi:hypothetical protein
LLAVVAALLVPPQASLAQEPGEDMPPDVSNAYVSPGYLDYTGGDVYVNADVVDDFGVTMVYADAYGPDGLQSVQLVSSGATTYSGHLNIPPNHTPSAVSYSVTVQAWDTNGATDYEEAGEVQVGPEPQFDQAPYVSDPLVQPRDLPAAGGTATISATATDDRSIADVFAIVTSPGGATTDVWMAPVSSSQFEAAFTAPANTTAAAETYAVLVVAQDDIGQSASADGGVFTVAAQPPASGGRLKLRPARIPFGRVRVGRRATRTFRLQHVGRSTAPISGVISASGAPFSVAGAGPRGISFTLRAGETRMYVVEFGPTAIGSWKGAVEIDRADGKQPDLAVALAGRA